jgi:hypothetical protein
MISGVDYTQTNWADKEEIKWTKKQRYKMKLEIT